MERPLTRALWVTRHTDGKEQLISRTVTVLLVPKSGASSACMFTENWGFIHTSHPENLTQRGENQQHLINTGVSIHLLVQADTNNTHPVHFDPRPLVHVSSFSFSYGVFPIMSSASQLKHCAILPSQISRPTHFHLRKIPWWDKAIQAVSLPHFSTKREGVISEYDNQSLGFKSKLNPLVYAFYGIWLIDVVLKVCIPVVLKQQLGSWWVLILCQNLNYFFKLPVLIIKA